MVRNSYSISVNASYSEAISLKMLAKGKVNLVLNYVIKAYAVKAYEAVEV
jgi:hypothetical protein